MSGYRKPYPGLHQKQCSSRVRKGILSLCSVLVRHDVECCILLQGPQDNKDVVLLEQVQRRATAMIRGMEPSRMKTGGENWSCSV